MQDVVQVLRSFPIILIGGLSLFFSQSESGIVVGVLSVTENEKEQDAMFLFMSLE